MLIEESWSKRCFGALFWRCFS